VKWIARYISSNATLSRYRFNLDLKHLNNNNTVIINGSHFIFIDGFYSYGGSG
jgi:hypothetical protein